MSHITADIWERGSTWRRWDPHLHAPGTALNDQFNDDWDGYLRAIETAQPLVEAIGVTDYLSIQCYKAVKARRDDGHLKNVKLLFPNVEIRLDLQTEKKRAINLHLLFSPDDPNHEQHIERVLAELIFEFKGRKYRCTSLELQELGRSHSSAATADDAARCIGANQFKVTLDNLRELFRGDAWIARNCIVAVATSNHDGTAGLQKDSAFAALRQEIERFAHVMFAATPATRDFWLGKHPTVDLAKLEAEFGGKKACLHGSDAHSVARTCTPDDARYCWLKGDPTFETLRQSLLEPEERVWIGPAAPDRHDAGLCISQVATRNAPWLANDSIPLNPGLVAIIGSRGSGKTALADIIAIGADVTSPLSLESSFVCRASRPINHLADAEVSVSWGDGANQMRELSPIYYDDSPGQVRYLSQQFVEQLCSAEGLAVELRREIERVIFDATDPTDRLDADSFDDLADIHLGPLRRERAALRESIENTSSEVNAEDALQQRLPMIKREVDEHQGRVRKIKEEMKSLLPKGKDERTKRLAELEAALASAATVIDKEKRSSLTIDDLKKEADRIRRTTAPQELAKLMRQFQLAGLSSEQWHHFSMVFRGDVDAVMTQRKTEVAANIKLLSEGKPGRIVDTAKEPLPTWPYNLLLTERDKVKKEVGIDEQKQRRYTHLQQELQAEEKLCQRLAADLKHAEGATARKQSLIERRRSLYADIFQSYLDEQTVLQRLYAPMQQGLEEAEGSLNRLRFSVSREIDLAAWVSTGEGLLDLRKDSKLRGHGALQKEAGRLLMPAWQSGTADEVALAMQTFIQELAPEIRKSKPSNITEEQTSEWMQQIASWIYSTDHIELRYSMTYDGVAIEKLSQGTRGIVLLLLYLVIDKHDRRPLIIDQPEESLDPKSVFDELVPHFRDACKRRQVIIVTHNANLVVNTDADQVIVATSDRKDANSLPAVTYHCGSIENPTIRTAICEILEGGERAFLDRERRYRLHWKAQP